MPRSSSPRASWRPRRPRAVEALTACLGDLTGAIVARTVTPSELPAAGWGDRASVDWALAARVVAELTALLGEASMRANRLYEQHAPALRAALGEAAPEFERRLRSFEYPEALDVLRREVMVEPRLRLPGPG